MNSATKPKTSKLVGLGNTLLTVAQALLCFSLFVVAAIALLFTGRDSTLDTNPNYLVEGLRFWSFNSLEGTLMTALSLLCAALVLLLISRLKKLKVFNVNLKAFTGVCMAFLLITQTLWILSLNAKTNAYPDSASLRMIADYLLTGQFTPNIIYSTEESMLEYLQLYPVQAGGVYLTMFFYWLFGDAGTQAFQFANALANTGTALLLVWATWMISGKNEAANICALLCALCLPLIFSCAYVYVNSISLFFSFLALTLTMHSMQKNLSVKSKVASTILAFISIAIAIMIKLTCILFLIVMFVLLLIESMRKKSVLTCALTIVLTVCTVACSSLPTKALENQMNTDFGDGMPLTSWLAIGLTYKGFDELPGWWYGIALDIRTSANNDYAQQTEIGKEVIYGACKKFLSDPAYTGWFFGKKLISEWSDPMFESIYYSNQCRAENFEGASCNAIASDIQLGTSGKLLHVLADGMQNVVIVLALLYAIDQFRCRKTDGDDRTMRCILPSCVVLGFFLYIFWEAKSVYMLPFCLCMIPMAATQLQKRLQQCVKKH